MNTNTTKNEVPVIWTSTATQIDEPTASLQKLMFKKQHPMLFHLKQLGWSAVVVLGLAAVSAIGTSLFHFLGGMEWGNSTLAFIALSMAIFCIWFLVNSFQDKGPGKWVMRGFAIVIAGLFTAVLLIYFCYMLPTYGA